jgi:hypothetical protein
MAWHLGMARFRCVGARAVRIAFAARIAQHIAHRSAPRAQSGIAPPSHRRAACGGGALSKSSMARNNGTPAAPRSRQTRHACIRRKLALSASHQ